MTWHIVAAISLASCVLAVAGLGITGKVRRYHGWPLMLIYLGVAIAILCALLLVASEIAFWVRGEEWLR